MGNRPLPAPPPPPPVPPPPANMLDQLRYLARYFPAIYKNLPPPLKKYLDKNLNKLGVNPGQLMELANIGVPENNFGKRRRSRKKVYRRRSRSKVGKKRSKKYIKRRRSRN